MAEQPYSSSTLWGRKYKIIIASESGSGMEVTGLHAIFTVEKAMSESPNNSNIKIYNLSKNSRNTIISEGDRVIIEAGYEGPQYGLIYDGDVIQSLQYDDDSITNVTELISQDGDIFLNKGFITMSLAPGADTNAALEALASNGGDPNMSVGYVSDDLKGTKLARGKVMFGQPKEFARRLARSEEGLFYINDRKIVLTKPADLPPDEIVSLSYKTGLIGSPEITDDGGVKARCLLNPLLNINKLVYIEQSKNGGNATGVWKILTLTHTGDTRGNDWYTDFTGIAQPNTTPVTGNSYAK